MLKKNVSILVSVLVILSGCQREKLPNNDNLIIAREGLSSCTIVVDENASVPVRHAAAELEVYLNRITGATFETIHKPSPEHTNIFVGPGAAKMADVTFTTDGLGAEGIIIRTTNNGLIWAGGEPRGTLYAVYTFLQDELGCRWWTSTAETVPERKTIELSKLDIRYIPSLEYRESFWFDSFDGDWAVRNKSNGNHCRLGDKHGGKQRYIGFVHTFATLLPPETYFEEHPEWFSLIDGERKGANNEAQLCLTNEQMHQELVKNLKEKLRQRPDATIASVSQNDGWGGNCQCSKCIAVEEQEGSPAGLMIQFVNSVAAEIEKEFPHIGIDTLAYTYTQKPPLHVRPRENVIVRLCNYESSFAKPLTDPCNKEFYDDIKNWSKICDRIYIWNYVTNFSHYVQPHPNLRVLGPNIKFFVENNVKGIFEQGAYQSPGAEMAELRSWVIAQLLWNPNQDAAKLIEEFIGGYYGPATPYIKSYLDLTHDAVEESGDWLGCYSPPDANFLSLETLTKGWELLNEAGTIAKGSPEYLERIDLVKLPVMYVFLVRWNDLKSQSGEAVSWPINISLDEFLEEFIQIAEKNKITHLSEPVQGFGKLRDIVKQQKEEKTN